MKTKRFNNVGKLSLGRPCVGGHFIEDHCVSDQYGKTSTRHWWAYLAVAVVLLSLLILMLFWVSRQNSAYAFLLTPPEHPAIGGLAEYAAADAYELEKQARKSLLSRLNRLDKPVRLDFELKPYTGIRKQQSAHLFERPVHGGIISSHFGMRKDPFNGKIRFHRGVDIAAQPGTAIVSPASGFVVFAGRKGGYGKVVEILHDKATLTRYAHLQNILVSQGQVVRRGEQIAEMGSTGRSTGPHLHLEVLKNGKQVNPEIYFNGALIGVKTKH